MQHIHNQLALKQGYSTSYKPSIWWQKEENFTFHQTMSPSCCTLHALIYHVLYAVLYVGYTELHSLCCMFHTLKPHTPHSSLYGLALDCYRPRAEVYLAYSKTPYSMHSAVKHMIWTATLHALYCTFYIPDHHITSQPCAIHYIIRTTVPPMQPWTATLHMLHCILHAVDCNIPYSVLYFT